MKLKVFTVYDCKAGAFLQPFYTNAAGAAIRGIMDCLDNPSHTFARHTADYTLFEIGEFDEESGVISMHEAKVNLGCLLQYKKDSTSKEMQQ